MPRRTKRQTQLEKQIEQLYYKHAAGRSISVMDIGNVYRDVTEAVQGGQDVEAAVIAAVEKYTSAA